MMQMHERLIQERKAAFWKDAISTLWAAREMLESCNKAASSVKNYYDAKKKREDTNRASEGR
jgi:hypothetical protein